jgi:hypothetical protein
MTTTPRFYNFDLSVEATEAGYRARVLASPGGQADSYFYLPFEDEELAAIAAWPAGDLGGLTPLEVRGRLFDAIFVGPVAEVLRTSLARAGDDGLRINLRLNDTPELMPLPWELLYDPGLGRFTLPLRADAGQPLSGPAHRSAGDGGGRAVAHPGRPRFSRRSPTCTGD